MMRDGQINGVTPWSFFPPVALAVLIGVLAAGLVLRAIDATLDAGPVVAFAAPAEPDAAPDMTAPVPARGAAPEATAVAVPVEPVPQPESLPQPDPGPMLIEAAPEPAVARQDSVAQSTVPALPGPILAKREGAPEACINGTIALRQENGWQQQLENGVSVPCIEAAAPAP